MQNVRHSAEQKTQFLQQINYKEKKKRDDGETFILKRQINQLQCVDLVKILIETLKEIIKILRQYLMILWAC